MQLSIEYNVFEDGSAAVEVDGTRVVYLRPVDGAVIITVVAYNEFGLSPIRQPKFKSYVAAAKRQSAMRGRRRKSRSQEVA